MIILLLLILLLLTYFHLVIISLLLIKQTKQNPFVKTIRSAITWGVGETVSIKQTKSFCPKDKTSNQNREARVRKQNENREENPTGPTMKNEEEESNEWGRHWMKKKKEDLGFLRMKKKN
ncbi:hypothetical protein ACE6H2_027029 [Prunus campanulata]